MDFLIKAVWTLFQGLGVLGLLAVFILFFPDKVKLIQASITQLIGKFSFWARKSTIKNRIEGHCDSAIKAFHKELPDVNIPKLVVEWVNGDNAETIVKDNEAVVLLQYSKNDTLNIVKATTAYVKDAFLPHVKPYLSDSFRNSFDLSVIRFVLLRIQKNSKSTVSRFVKDNTEALQENTAVINKMEKVNDAGLFTRLLIRELDGFGNNLMGRTPEVEQKKEADDFLEFLYDIAKRERDEYTKLAFVRPDIKVGVLLVAKIDNYSSNGINPYLNRIKKGFALGVNTFYLLAREDRIDILEEVYKGLVLTGNFNLINKPKVFYDRNGREAKCYCISVNKEGALNNAYDDIREAMDTGDELESIVTHVREDRITIDYNGLKGVVYKQNLSSQPITDAFDYFVVGATVYAKPIEITSDGDVEFSLTGTKSDPVNIFSNYKIGMKIEATVSYADDDFIKFTIPGKKTKGIAFRQDLTFSRFLLLHQKFPVGSTLTMIIKELELDTNSIVLQLSDLHNPWKEITIKQDDNVKVSILKKDVNALVGEIEEGITAVLMNQELSWNEDDIDNVRRRIRLNDIIDCTVIRTDLKNRAVYVSLRKLQESPYRSFFENNKGKDVDATISYSDAFGVYGKIDSLQLFIPIRETYRGKKSFSYKKAKIAKVRVIDISDRGDSIIGSFLPFIQYPLASFEQKYPVNSIIDNLKPSKKDRNYIQYQFKNHGKTYEMSLSVKDVASVGHVDDLTLLYNNVKSIPLAVKEIDLERSRISLSLTQISKYMSNNITYQYGQVYEGIVLSSIRGGYTILLLKDWIEVRMNSDKNYNTGDKILVMPERLSEPMTFIET
jgi:small subunit ribosomal protein S1